MVNQNKKNSFHAKTFSFLQMATPIRLHILYLSINKKKSIYNYIANSQN